MQEEREGDQNKMEEGRGVGNFNKIKIKGLFVNEIQFYHIAPVFIFVIL